jgi:hypothetical protein
VLAGFIAYSHYYYPLPLKGRASVSQNDSQVLHLDADLVNEVHPINSKREHFSVDYKPVVFAAHKTELWLPQTVDTYIQYRLFFPQLSSVQKLQTLLGRLRTKIIRRKFPRRNNSREFPIQTFVPS